MNAIANYLEDLSSTWGAAWNRFWFQPASPAGVSLLRLLTGTMACWFLLSFIPDLTIWFGADGLLPIDMVRQLTQSPTGDWNGRASYLYLSDDPRWLIAVHVAAMMVAVAFTVGFMTRVTSVLTLIVVLSYVHRGPVIMGLFEPVLTMLLFYLCFSPCGNRFSVDRWLANRRREKSSSHPIPQGEQLSIVANVCQRLIQVHVAGLYLMMGLTKLGGEDWWGGEAMWWLIAHSDTRVVDLTFLHKHDYFLNLWTLAVVVLEIVFAFLIWRPLARPLLLSLAVLHWLSLGFITGQLSFSVIMLIANLSFIDPAMVGSWSRAVSGGGSPEVASRNV